MIFFVQYPGQSLVVTNSQFLNNTAKPTIPAPASSSYGAALAILENCTGARTTPVTATISNSLFDGNSVQSTTFSGVGGAIFTDSIADMTITNTRIVNNTVITPNPPVANQVYRGGGIYGHAKSLTIVRSEISDNTADVGGGLSLFNNASDL